MFWELMAWLKYHFWKEKGWHYPDIDDNMTAIAALLGYDLANRGGEVTTVGGATNENHSINNEQVSFRLEEPVTIRGVVYFAIAAGSEDFRRYLKLGNVASCEIEVASHKAGSLSSHNKKESEFLDDLVEWCMRSGSTSREPLFSRRAMSGRKITFKKLHPKMSSDAIKKAASCLGMDPEEFANHFCVRELCPR